MDTILRQYRGEDYRYESKLGVIGQDYYKDHLVANLHDGVLPHVPVQEGMHVLDMATGHGYSAIILAKHYRDRIAKIVAYDINPGAVEMAKRNADRHACADKIDFRIGTLFEPLSSREQFHLILSALPPVPVTTEQLSSMPEDVRAHHWVASTAGRTGRDLLDAMIDGAPRHLEEGGLIATATADFQNASRHTLRALSDAGLEGWRVGAPAKRPVAGTKLTTLAMQNIRSLGYQFQEDEQGPFFHIETYAGKRTV